MSNDNVDLVRVSEATRREARGQKDRATLEEEIAVTERVIYAGTTRDIEIQTRLAEINNEIAGRRLLPSHYRALCEEQISLKRELAEVHQSKRELQNNRRRLMADLHAASKGKRPSIETLLEQLIGEMQGMRRDLRSFMRGNGQGVDSSSGPPTP